MKKILVMLMLVFAFGCSDDSTEPSKETIVGKWMKLIDDKEEYNFDILIMEFDKDGKYIAIAYTPGSERDTLNGNYTYENNSITLNDNECEGKEGKYKLEFRNNGVDFKLIEDECDRSALITGFFDKYKATLYSK